MGAHSYVPPADTPYDLGGALVPVDAPAAPVSVVHVNVPPAPAPVVQLPAVKPNYNKAIAAGVAALGAAVPSGATLFTGLGTSWLTFGSTLGLLAVLVGAVAFISNERTVAGKVLTDIKAGSLDGVAADVQRMLADVSAEIPTSLAAYRGAITPGHPNSHSQL